MRELTGSEAIFGFVAWLTTQEESITASGHHDAAVWANKIEEFCKVNNLSEPREGWAEHLIHPSGEVAIANQSTTELTEEMIEEAIVDMYGEESHKEAKAEISEGVRKIFEAISMPNALRQISILQVAERCIINKLDLDEEKN